MTVPNLPPDLPVLTDIIDVSSKFEAIPMLTDVVTTQDFERTVASPVMQPPPSGEPPVQSRDPYSIANMASELIWSAPAAAATPPPPDGQSVSDAEMQRLLDHFEAHLESVFTDKLNRHLAQLHHQAVKLAISELKKELPELLRNVLKQIDRTR